MNNTIENYAIFRTEKLKSIQNITSSLHHTFRSRKTPNANPELSKENKVLIGGHSTNEVLQDYKNRLSNLAARKNSVLGIELLQTYSPESDISLNDWCIKNINWNKKIFGAKNIISSVLHKDETTPHIVTYVVPEHDNKLNCRHFLGGREKLRKLQTDYANNMKEFGLRRGKEKSRANHKTIKKYYEELNSVRSENVNEASKKIKIMENNYPKKEFLESSKNYEEKAKNYTKKQIINLIKENGSLKLELKNMTNIEKENSELYEQIKKLETRYAILVNDKNLNKENIAILRKMDISKVADRLEYYHEISPKINAIDLVMKVQGFNYKSAVAWLYNEFGDAITGQLVAEDLSCKKPEIPLNRMENSIKLNMKKQLEGLGCNRYRLTLVANNKDVKPFLPGKYNNRKNVEEEKFFSTQDLLNNNMIKYLITKNKKENYNIFITPMDDNAYYILLDDCEKSLEELKEMGFQPCIHQNSSTNSEQAVFKIPKKYNRDKVVIPFFNELNQRYGDKKINGLRHPFRLAGFFNMKPKYERNGQYPIVTMNQCINTFCTKCMGILKRKQDELEQNKIENEKTLKRGKVSFSNLEF